MVLLPEGLHALKPVAKEVGVDLRGASLHLDGGFDSGHNRQCVFNAGLIPNIPENPCHRKRAKRGRKRLFNATIHALRMRVERTLAWEDTCKRLLLRLEHCFVPEEMVFTDLLIPNVGDFLAANESSINLPYTAVYLGVGCAVLRAIAENVRQRHPSGYTQSLAYHPDIRRRIAKMSAELEAGRWLLRYAAWVADHEGQTPAAQAAYFQAKYIVGEAVAAATRSALEMGGAHALFTGAPLERLFRDGATATMMQPSSDVCLAELSIYQLDLDRAALPPPLARGEG
jgi:Acyl-CoA dehydrogenase, C-terminal domain